MLASAWGACAGEPMTCDMLLYSTLLMLFRCLLAAVYCRPPTQQQQQHMRRRCRGQAALHQCPSQPAATSPSPAKAAASSTACPQQQLTAAPLVGLPAGRLRIRPCHPPRQQQQQQLPPPPQFSSPSACMSRSCSRLAARQGRPRALVLLASWALTQQQQQRRPVYRSL
jgi:hypothetical protein